METLDVKPSVLFEVEDFPVFFIDFSVAMRPNTCLVKFKKWMHSCTEKIGMELCFQKTPKRFDCVLHVFFESYRGLERFIRLYFHDV